MPSAKEPTQEASETSDKTSPRLLVVPFHIWRHEAVVAAIRRGADAELVREHAKQRGITAYRAGEPISMFTDELVFVAKRRLVERRADAERTSLRAMLVRR